MSNRFERPTTDNNNNNNNNNNDDEYYDKRRERLRNSVYNKNNYNNDSNSGGRDRNNNNRYNSFDIKKNYGKMRSNEYLSSRMQGREGERGRGGGGRGGRRQELPSSSGGLLYRHNQSQQQRYSHYNNNNNQYRRQNYSHYNEEEEEEEEEEENDREKNKRWTESQPTIDRFGSNQYITTDIHSNPNQHYDNYSYSQSSYNRSNRSSEYNDHSNARWRSDDHEKHGGDKKARGNNGDGSGDQSSPSDPNFSAHKNTQYEVIASIEDWDNPVLPTATSSSSSSSSSSSYSPPNHMDHTHPSTSLIANNTNERQLTHEIDTETTHSSAAPQSNINHNTNQVKDNNNNNIANPHKDNSHPSSLNSTKVHHKTYKRSSDILLSTNFSTLTLGEQSELLFFEYDLAPSQPSKSTTTTTNNTQSNSNAPTQQQQQQPSDKEKNETTTGETINTNENIPSSTKLNLPSEEEMLKMINPSGKFLPPAVKRKLLDEMIEKLTPSNLKEKIEEQKDNDRKKLPRPPEYDIFHKFYQTCETFVRLQQQRRDGFENEHVERFFDLKYRNQDNSNRSSDQNVVQLFRRFYRYAIDIDNGCDYVAWMTERATRKQVSYFLDIGFAPGGMSKLLLDSCDAIRGIGITLPPESKGNAIIRELYRHKKFLCRELDICTLGKQVNRRIDFMKLCKLENEQTFPGFDLVIIGITIHQEFDEAGYQRLDHQILLSELYVAFHTLARGGAILMRHKISLDLIHQHILYMMLTCFDNFKCHKPMTEFAIRKTFWILWTGFDSVKARPFTQNLRQLIHADKDKPPYAINRELGKFFDPSMVKKSAEEIIAEKGSKILEVMTPMFEVQLRCIEDYCQGKKDRMCKRKDDCNDSDCMKAHNDDELLRGVKEAQDAVDKRMYEQIIQHGHASPILLDLHKLMKRPNGSQRPKHHHHQYQQYHHYQVQDVRNLTVDDT